MSILKQIAEGVALQEVSKALLGRYIGKAREDSDRHQTREKAEWQKADVEPDADKSGKAQLKATAHGKVVDKREKGISLAFKKLAKEDVEELQEKRGRRKKPRHEDGEIVNDPDANDTKPAV